MNRIVNTDTILGTVSFVAGIILLQSSYAQSEAVFVLPGDAPPFLVPQLMLCFMLGVGGLMIIQGLRKGGVAVRSRNWINIGLSLTIIAGATALMKLLGYLVVAPVSVFAIIAVLGYRNHLVNLLVSAGVVALLYLLLVNFAQMPLPKIPGMDI